MIQKDRTIKLNFYYRNSQFIIAIVFSSILFFNSCKKDKKADTPIVPGTITMEVHAIHHSWDVAGIMIYLKRNATEFPGKDSSKYEYKGLTDGYGKYSFEHLYPGNYYLYASGYDSYWGSHVIGELPVSIETANLTDNYTLITLMVSE